MFTATGGPTDLPLVVLGHCVGVVDQYHATHNRQSTLKRHGQSQITGILCSSHILASELLCYYCRRSSYLCDNWFLQLCSIKQRSPMKLHITEQYDQHMGHVDNSDRMANSYSMSWRSFWWTTKLFFHLLDLTVLNSWILLSSYGAI